MYKYKLEEISPGKWQVRGPGMYDHDPCHDYRTAWAVMSMVERAYVKGQASVLASRHPESC